jgi:diaminopimelate decarboxylase
MGAPRDGRGSVASAEVDRLPAIADGLRLAARRHGTPVAVTDLRSLRDAAERLRAAFPDPWIRAFSVKANDVAGIVERLAGLGLDANVVSRGEWAVARRAGLPNERITLEGVGKASADLAAAVRAAREGRPPRWVALESADEAAALAAIARRGLASGTLDLLFRLNPEVAPETHAQLAVGAPGAKFGMAATELTAAIEATAHVAGLVPRGVHLHVGSQLRAVDAWRDAVRRALALLALVRGSRPEFDTLDVGGGFPVLPPGAIGPGPERFARELPALLAAIPPDRRPSRFAVEPGRFLVARSGWLVASVLHVRQRDGRQVVIDAGMSELIRPALYGATHPIAALTSLGRPVDPLEAGGRGPDATREPARVEGPICESTDTLGQHALPPLRRGDLVAIGDAGAYAASMSMTYNGRPRPPQILLDESNGLTLMRPRGRVGSLG